MSFFEGGDSGNPVNDYGVYNYLIYDYEQHIKWFKIITLSLFSQEESQLIFSLFNVACSYTEKHKPLKKTIRQIIEDNIGNKLSTEDLKNFVELFLQFRYGIINKLWEKSHTTKILCYKMIIYLVKYPISKSNF